MTQGASDSKSSSAQDTGGVVNDHGRQERLSAADPLTMNPQQARKEEASPQDDLGKQREALPESHRELRAAMIRYGYEQEVAHEQKKPRKTKEERLAGQKVATCLARGVMTERF